MGSYRVAVGINIGDKRWEQGDTIADSDVPERQRQAWLNEGVLIADRQVEQLPAPKPQPQRRSK